MIETKSPSSRFPDNTTEGNIPVKKSGAYENSNISQDPTGEIRAATKIIAEGGIDVPPATITIGDGVNIKASGPQQINESNVTGIRYQFPHQEIDKTGTQKTFNIKVLAETLNNARQPVFDTQLVSPASVPETSASNQIINAIYIRTDGDIDNFHYEIKDVTTGATADSYPNKYDYAKDVGVSIPGAGIHKIDLYYSGDSAPPRFLSGQDIILTMKWDNAGGTVLGDSLGKPFYELDTQEFEFINMVDIEDSVTALSDVSNAGSGAIITGSERTKLLGIETGAESNQTDSEIKTQYENNANTNVYTDSEKTKLGSLTGGRYLGVFADLTALQTAYVTGITGDSATVTTPNGNLFYWNGSAWADSGTGFIGDMNKATFDPTAKNADVFDMDNMDESATKKVLTNTERSEIAANTTHKSSDGSDHSFIDQDVKSGVSPTFDSANFTGVGGQLKVARISGSTFSTVQHMQDIFHSAGHVEGGLITDAGSNTVNGDLGKGFIRATDSRVSELLFFDWPQNLGISVPLNTTRYIGVEYNAGSPLIAARATDNFDDTTSFFLAVCVNEGGAIHIKNSPHSVGDHAANMIIRLKESMGIKRDNVTKGLIIAETGTRKITVTAGALWDRLTRFPITTINTSVSDTFDRYFTTAPGVHTKQAAQTDWDNTQYNNVATGLVTLNNNRYAVQWWYLELDGALLCLYGTEQHNSLAEAEAEGVPVDVPDRVANLSLLIARTIFQKSDSTLTKIESAFSQVFGGAIVTDHGSMGGLPDDDHPNSKLLNGRASDITELNAATYTLLTTDYLVHVLYTTTGAVTSLTIPTAQIAGSREFTIKDGGGNAGANSITIDTEGSETINGAATFVLNTNYEAVTLYSHDGNLYSR